MGAIVYVADMLNHRIQKFTGGGTYLTQWGSKGSEEGQFLSQMGVAVDSNGAIYVSDTENSRVQMFIDDYPWPDPVSGLIQNGSFELSPALKEWTIGGTLPIKRANCCTMVTTRCN